MPTQRFEGTTFDQAVEAALSHAGPQARIVAANRVRKGGLGGFFAREHVEVEVEVPRGAGGAGGAGGRAGRGQPRHLAAGPAGPPAPGTNTERAAAEAVTQPQPVISVPGANGRPAQPRAAAPSPAAPPPATPAARPLSNGTSSTSTGPTSPGSSRTGPSRTGPSSSGPLGVPSPAAQTGPRAASAGAGQARLQTSPPLRSPGPATGARRLQSATAPSSNGPRSAPAPAGRPGVGGPVGAQPQSVPPGTADPLSSLIEEMAESGPSSVLDLAERVNDQEGHFALDRDETGAPKPGPPKPGPPPNFAAVLARIAVDAGLITPEGTPTARTRTAPGPMPSPRPEAAPPAAVEAALPVPAKMLNMGLALRQLGVPMEACRGVRPVAGRDDLESELARALRGCLPSLPEPPRSPNSVVVVVGPKGEVMAAAWALAEELGTPPDDVAVATKRQLWGHQDKVIATAVGAAEQRRSWRWRSAPSVVAVEQDVRPGQADWASSVLRALSPTLCWGVASATHKPEDLAAWSDSLGGLDAIALVDLDATTTPAAALSSPVPVGKLDGCPATPERWAKVLCDRLLG